MPDRDPTQEWRKIYLTLGHFAPNLDFWLTVPIDEALEWCVALNELLDPERH